MSNYLMWTHPKWHNYLVTEDDDYAREQAETYCPDNPELLQCEPIEMSEEEYEALSEFDGE